ncbi:MAG: AIR synthase-related protein, partial [Candidatus Edwardsbacteria bacterium]|nr:AIR synthase-related protein [Candidatus Edwardsbacteria bacterium]
DNIPRVLPATCNVEITLGSWPVPPVFELLREQGGVPQDEMYRAFNMGIGFVLVVAAKDEMNTMKMLKTMKTRAYRIGRVVRGKRTVMLHGPAL